MTFCIFHVACELTLARDLAIGFVARKGKREYIARYRRLPFSEVYPPRRFKALKALEMSLLPVDIEKLLHLRRKHAAEVAVYFGLVRSAATSYARLMPIYIHDA